MPTAYYHLLLLPTTAAAASAAPTAANAFAAALAAATTNPQQSRADWYGVRATASNAARCRHLFVNKALGGSIIV